MSASDGPERTSGGKNGRGDPANGARCGVADDSYHRDWDDRHQDMPSAKRCFTPSTRTRAGTIENAAAHSEHAGQKPASNPMIAATTIRWDASALSDFAAPAGSVESLKVDAL